MVVYVFDSTEAVILDGEDSDWAKWWAAHKGYKRYKVYPVDDAAVDGEIGDYDEFMETHGLKWILVEETGTVYAREWYVQYPLDAYAMGPYEFDDYVGADEAAETAKKQFGEYPAEVWPEGDSIEAGDTYEAWDEEEEPYEEEYSEDEYPPYEYTLQKYWADVDPKVLGP